MSTTQVSPFNLDSDARKFTFSIIFIVPLNISFSPYISAPYGFTVNTIKAECFTGSINLTMKKVHSGTETTFGSVSNIPIGTAGVVITPTSGNSVLAGDRLTIALTNTTNCTVLNIQVNCTEDFVQS